MWANRQSTSQGGGLLTHSQRTTAERIRAALEAGETEVTVWGVSGSGKSSLARCSELAGAVAIYEDGERRMAVLTPSRELVLKTGIPENPATPSQHIWHRGFSQIELVSLCGELTRERGADAAVSPADIAEALSLCQMGSTIYLERLAEHDTLEMVSEELAGLFAIECQRADNSRLIETFDSLSSLVPSSSSVAGRILLTARTHLEEYETNWSEFAALAHKRNATPVKQELCDIIKAHTYPDQELPSATHETFEWYKRIPWEVVSAKETQFLIRTQIPVANERLSQLCQKLLPLLKDTGHRSLLSLDRPTAEGIPRMWGNIGRKTGLYVYSAQEGLDESYCSWDGRSYVSVFSQSAFATRVQRPALHAPELGPIPDRALLFAGGDHALDRPHTVACLLVEVLLQSHRVPYIVWRGRDDTESLVFNFDGERLERRST
ncbi:MAG: hypothetical protein RL326_1959 [Pseudomonadota bacterium]|jgi:hypothetical protein